jgi:hypothetical protein
MRVYYFTKEKYAIDNLKNERIKISQFKDLNDPFEMLALQLSDKKIRKTFKIKKKKFAKGNGMICFSKKWSNPVMWSHYAERHKGICLGFDVADDYLFEVEYSANRLAKDILDEDGNLLIDKEYNEKLLRTKYASWEYEKEVRMIVEFDHKEEKPDMRFLSFDDDIVLREVILGAERNKGVSKIESLLQDYENVRLIQGKMAFKYFRINEDIRITKRLNGEN